METVLVEEDLPAAAAPAACPECGEPILERFCTRCGEKRVEARDYSLRHYLGEALNVFANLESPIPRSFFALIFRPGLLTAEYLTGRRKRYLKPLQLFVLCNLIFFFAQPLTGFNTLTTPLNVHLNGMPYKQTARRMVGAEVERRKTTLDEYHARFNTVIQNQAKSLVILMVPMLATVLLALYWRGRRYFVEHLVFATHFYSFLLLLLLAVSVAVNIYFRVVRRFALPVPDVDYDLIASFIILAACAVYLSTALRRVYGQARWLTFLKCAFLIFAAICILQLYRFILFFTAYYTA